jgi:hypothetical protein
VYADGGKNAIKTYYYADNTVIQYSHLLPKEAYPIKINCDKRLPTDKQYKITYRESELKIFPIVRLEIEKEILTFVTNHNYNSSLKISVFDLLGINLQYESLSPFIFISNGC